MSSALQLRQALFQAPQGCLSPCGEPQHALVIELARPADWATLAPLWRGVQLELGWPAPAIAVNGSDGFQLWMALRTPVPGAQAHALLQALCRRLLPTDLPPSRLRFWPDPGSTQPWRLPPHELLDGAGQATERWAALVAPDLAPVFDETPWLDLPPSDEGQAELLGRLQPITPEAFEAAQVLLSASTAKAAPALDRPEPEPRPAQAGPAPLGPDACLDPRQFLLRVMNDPAVPLAQRIEAARALLV